MSEGPFVMQFGKYKGQEICDVPSAYLHWLVDRKVRDPLRTALLNELRRRIEQDYNEQPAQPLSLLPHIDHDVACMVVEAGRRSMARSLHPDRPGGDVEAMQAVNHCCDCLLKALRQTA